MLIKELFFFTDMNHAMNLLACKESLGLKHEIKAFFIYQDTNIFVILILFFYLCKCVFKALTNSKSQEFWDIYVLWKIVIVWQLEVMF